MVTLMVVFPQVVVVSWGRNGGGGVYSLELGGNPQSVVIVGTPVERDDANVVTRNKDVTWERTS